MVLLGVNIDHVATVRNARGGNTPEPFKAALIAEASGADGITVHLREDRRHIKDDDLRELKSKISTRLNLEMANTSEMIETALMIMPYMVTLVPEKRQEVTTEGGLDVIKHLDSLKQTTEILSEAGILVSLFVDTEQSQLEACRDTGAPYIELHTGCYCNAHLNHQVLPSPSTEHILQEHLNALNHAAEWSEQNNIKVNAGHGLNYQNIYGILSIPNLVELNIGHSIIAQSIFVGLGVAVKEMKRIISNPGTHC